MMGWEMGPPTTIYKRVDVGPNTGENCAPKYGCNGQTGRMQMAMEESDGEAAAAALHIDTNKQL